MPACDRPREVDTETSIDPPRAVVVVMEDFEVSRVDAFFKKVTSRFSASGDTMALVITHLLPERPAFLRAVGRAVGVAAVLPKPKSIDARALREITGLMPVEELDRAAFTDPGHVLAVLEARAAGRDVGAAGCGRVLRAHVEAHVRAFLGADRGGGGRHRERPSAVRGLG
ncbi:adenosylhomocysteinase [Sinosporangium album]|uniref:Adenosylhomocysteinase n=1 Tax=Sinosporangium album TaxID=504805 RepID=A0A1G8DW04_9ACTN|nr:hypothetical protein [Sinosporangium album]SDH61785.1 adenosylhomocysteinase [Sinosporangium album]